MPIQSFLPVVDTSRKTVLGLVAITPVDFVGTESDVDLDNAQGDPVNYPLTKYEPYTSRRVDRPWYMAITPRRDHIVARDHESIPGWIPIADVMPDAYWTSSSMGAFKVESLGTLIDGLIHGFGGSLSPGPANPTMGNDTPGFTWMVAVPFANSPQQAFYDINWVEAVGLLNNGQAPVYLVINSVTPNTKMRAVVLTKGQPALNRATFNTIRIVKVPGQVLNVGDTADIACTIYGQNGFTDTLTITVTVA